MHWCSPSDGNGFHVLQCMHRTETVEWLSKADKQNGSDTVNVTGSLTDVLSEAMRKGIKFRSQLCSIAPRTTEHISDYSFFLTLIAVLKCNSIVGALVLRPAVAELSPWVLVILSLFGMSFFEMAENWNFSNCRWVLGTAMDNPNISVNT